MKTTALILAVGLALVLPSMAAPYTLTVPNAEYRLVAAFRLQGPEIPLIGQLPPMQLFQYDTDTDLFLVAPWNLGQWGPDIVFGPGEGAIFQPSGGSATLLFQQSVAPRLPLKLQPGFNLVCCQSDVAASFEDVVGTPPANGTLLYQFNSGPGRNPFNLAAPDYAVFTFTNGVWSPTSPMVGITEAVFVFQPPQLSNFQLTSNGIAFEVTPPLKTQLAIEYSDSLTQPSWQVLTNVVGNGVSLKITDSSIGSAVRQRFYRARTSQ
jgi:hypothetical protein